MASRSIEKKISMVVSDGDRAMKKIANRAVRRTEKGKARANKQDLKRMVKQYNQSA